MNLIGRVLIMAVCVLTAYALPNLGNIGVAEENAMLKAIIAQMENTLTRPSAVVNNTQDSCFDQYTKRVNQINARTVNQTQECYEATNRAIGMYNDNVNQTVNFVNAQSKRLQNRLASCAARNSSEAVFNCNVASFDENLGNLYNLTVESQIAASYMSGYEFELNIATQACVGNVLVGSKTDTTAASNDLQICLNNATSGSSNSTKPGNRTMAYFLN